LKFLPASTTEHWSKGHDGKQQELPHHQQQQVVLRGVWGFAMLCARRQDDFDTSGMKSIEKRLMFAAMSAAMRTFCLFKSIFVPLAITRWVAFP
jgi:ABC-type amino acid transport system permease subunit